MTESDRSMAHNILLTGLVSFVLLFCGVAAYVLFFETTTADATSGVLLSAERDNENWQAHDSGRTEHTNNPAARNTESKGTTPATGVNSALPTPEISPRTTATPDNAAPQPEEAKRTLPAPVPESGDTPTHNGNPKAPQFKDEPAGMEDVVKYMMGDDDAALRFRLSPQPDKPVNVSAECRSEGHTRSCAALYSPDKDGVYFVGFHGSSGAVTMGLSFPKGKAYSDGKLKPINSIHLDIDAPGYARKSVDVDLAAKRKELGKDTKTFDIGIIELNTGATLSGTVTSPSGDAAAAAQVFLKPVGVLPGGFTFEGDESRHAAADSAGAFIFTALSDGEYELEARHPSGAPTRITCKIEHGAAPSHLAIKMTQGGELSGGVTIETANPPSQAEKEGESQDKTFLILVPASGANAAVNRFNSAFDTSGFMVQDGQRRVRVGKDGQFSMKRIPAGEYEVSIRKGDEEQHKGRITIMEGGVHRGDYTFAAPVVKADTR